MTSTETTDRHRGDKLARFRPFRLNPYEIAVAGGDESRRSALLQGLAAGPLAAFSTAIAHVLESESLATAPTLRLYAAGRHRVLSYTTDQDYLCASGPLLDADMALIGCSEADDVPLIRYLESDGRAAGGATDAVIAHVGPRGVCPILPSHAVYFADDDVTAIGGVLVHHLRNQVRKTPLYGLVLAGGKSERMGMDKARIAYHGMPQWERCRELLATHCDAVYVSVGHDAEPGAHGIPLEAAIPDRFIACGPVGGILSAMRTHPNAAWLALAVDMPFVDEAALKCLVSCRNPFRYATAYRSPENGLPEPLCAVYEPKSAFRLHHFLALGYSCPRKVLVNSRVHLIDPPDPTVLTNANTPDEAERVRHALDDTEETVQTHG